MVKCLSQSAAFDVHLIVWSKPLNIIHHTVDLVSYLASCQHMYTFIYWYLRHTTEE